jgi:hypothetical protein
LRCSYPARGRGLVEYMHKLEAQLLGDYERTSVASERPMRMLFGVPSDMPRIFKIRNFGRVLLRSDMET